MNKNGQLWFAYLFVVFLVFLTAFALIPVFKENLDVSRGDSTSLNCPGTPTFNQSNYDDDTTSQKLIRRPVCLVTGLSMVWFIGAIVISGTVWAYRRIVGR